MTDCRAAVKVDYRDVVLDEAMAAVERELGPLNAINRVAVRRIIERACRDWPQPETCW